MDNKINNNDTEVIKTENASAESESTPSEHLYHGSSHGRHHSSHHHHSGHHSNHHVGHHSSHRHSKHHSSNSKKKKLNINKKLVMLLSALMFTVLLVFVFVFENTNLNKNNSLINQSGQISSDVLSVELINGEGVLVRDAVNKYLLVDLLNPYNSNVLLYDFSNGEGQLDEQVPVILKFFVKEGNAQFYKVELAENDQFLGAIATYIESNTTTYEFEHLLANTTYFYRVTAYTSKGIVTQTGSFKTSDTPRILSIDGISNVRDIGNWKTDSGKRIKQGLLIRGTEMDGAVESEYHLTNEGLKDMLDVFGIKTDIDLRAQTATSMDALGSRVEHRYYGMVEYSGIFTEEGKEKIRMIFADLANPDNYPIYLHCTYGCDRTGTVCYLLEALLGVSRGDCLKDYGLSNLNIANIKAVEDGLKNYEGTTLKEQTESYLLSCGVTELQIESIRNIFLGD